MRKDSWNGVLNSALQVGLTRGLAVQLQDRTPLLETVLAIDHDDFTRHQAGVDKRLSLADLLDRYGTLLSRFVRRDNIDVGALLALLHGRCRDGQSVLPRLQQQPGIDKLSRPQLVAGVGKFGLELDGPCRLGDFVVDQQQGALIELYLVVLAIGNDLQRSLGYLLLDPGELRLRKGEEQRDRFDLRDDNKTVRIGRMNDITDIDLSDAGYAWDGRG